MNLVDWHGSFAIDVFTVKARRVAFQAEVDQHEDGSPMSKADKGVGD